MSTTTYIPVSEYLKSTEKPYREYRDGTVTPKAMPTKLHALIQYALMMLLDMPMLKALGLQPYPELTVRLSPTRYLVPDICVTADFPGPYPTEPVLLCCEILSPEDRLGAMFAKCEEYHAWGVPYCWVIDPIKRTAWEYHATSEPVRQSATLAAGNHSISLSTLFSYLDRP